MKIYLAGPITNNPNYKEQFFKAQKELESKGHIVLNPAVLPKGFEHQEYMHICYAMIDVCEGVYFLPGWEESKGARMERSYSIEHNKKLLKRQGNGELQPTYYTCSKCGKVFYLDKKSEEYEGHIGSWTDKETICPGCIVAHE